MLISFENMRERATSGDDDRPPAYGANTHADLIPFPSRSTIRAPLELPDVSNSPVYKSTVIIDAFCGALTGLGLVVAGVILLFVQT